MASAEIRQPGRRATVSVNGRAAAVLAESAEGPRNPRYVLSYLPDYDGPAISLTMPVRSERYEFESFPPFFDGLLPEGVQLEGLLRVAKVDENDLFGQLIVVGSDLVGAVTVEVAPAQGEES